MNQVARNLPNVGPAPLLSVVTPCYKTAAFFLERLTVSLWPVRDTVQWIIVNDSPDDPRIDAFAERMAVSFKHLKYVRHTANRGIFSAYTSGFIEADAPYIAILDHDDECDLAPLLRFLDHHREEYDLIYTDETKFAADRREQYAKPEFDALSAMHYFYMHHITCFRTSVCKGIIAAEPDAERHYRSCFDIWLAMTYQQAFGEQPVQAVRLPYASYGWRVHAASTASDLGQKPVADVERQTIAGRLYAPFNTGPAPVKIGLDEAARYVVRYEHPVSSTEVRAVLQQFVAAHFELGVVTPDGLRSDPCDPDDAVLLAALARVPTGYLARYVKGECLVVERKSLPVGSRLAEQAARHIPGVPFLAAAALLNAGELAGVLSGRPRRLSRKVADGDPRAPLDILVI